MNEYDGVPGLVEIVEGHKETTIVVEPASVIDAATWLRDDAGFNFLSDITAVDYLGWAEQPVAGYIGTPAGRDINRPATHGLQALPAAKPKRFSVSYHLLALREGAPRVRLQVWLDEGEQPPSVVAVWPTADWYEREAYDLMGIEFDGHPNMVRIYMADDWEGHPLRKDYPLGGEPVRFSEEQ